QRIVGAAQKVFGATPKRFDPAKNPFRPAPNRINPTPSQAGCGSPHQQKQRGAASRSPRTESPRLQPDSPPARQHSYTFRRQRLTMGQSRPGFHVGDTMIEMRFESRSWHGIEKPI